MVTPTNSLQQKLVDFDDKYDIATPDTPTMPDMSIRNLRMRLIAEEVAEFHDEWLAGDLEASIKELCDLLYVTVGTANAMGIDLEPFFAEVHRSNMSKVWPDGTVHRNEFGKIIKPPTYSPADIQSVLSDLTK